MNLFWPTLLLGIEIGLVTAMAVLWVGNKITSHR